MKKDFRLLEHNLIPLALFAANLSVVHFIYLLFALDVIDHHLLSVAVCIAGLSTGIIRKSKWVMLAAVGFYVLVIVSSLISPVGI